MHLYQLLGFCFFFVSQVAAYLSNFRLGINAVYDFQWAGCLNQTTNNGTAPTVKPHVATDASKTEETFGFVHKDYEEQVTSVVSHYLELVNKGL